MVGRTNRRVTRERLHDICVRKAPQDIVELRWEVKRLQMLALKIDQVQKSATLSGGLELESLRADFVHEPCVLEDARLRGE